jgi:hypothetical protein
LIVQLTLLIYCVHSILDLHPYLFSLGGPLIVPGETQDEDIQIGVVSWSYGCAQEYPGVYSRISTVFDWIKRNACKESLSQSKLCDGSYAPSLSPVMSPPTLSSAPSTGPIEGFTYVGVGFCVDSENEWYAGINTLLYDANDNDCMKWCSQVPHPDFVAVEAHHYGDGKINCFCAFSGGLPEDVDGTDYNPSAVYQNSYSVGVGPVQSSDGPISSCYRYDVSFLGCMRVFLLRIASHSQLHLSFK